MVETRTTKHITSTDPRKGFDGTAVPVIERGTPPFGWADFCRMSLNHDTNESYDPNVIADLIGGAGDRVLFLVDNGFVDDQTNPRIYEALLSKKGRVGVISRVHDELKPWMASRPSHVFAQAVKSRSEAIQFTDIDTTNSEKIAAAEYSLNALMDEGPSLVVAAVTTSLYESRETVILTKDQDVLEQFYKMQYLVDTHYRGLLLADRYCDDPKGLSTTLMPTDNPWLSEVFVVADAVLLEPRDRSFQDILPPAFTTTPYQCWFFGKQTNSLVRLGFAADADMKRLLEMKGSTRGLNTDKLEGKNCHIWLAPLPIDQKFRKCAIAKDRWYKIGRLEVPFLDALQAINCHERFIHLRTPGGYV